jgi:hypothetical protein
MVAYHKYYRIHTTRNRQFATVSLVLILLSVVGCSRFASNAEPSTPSGPPVMIFDRSGREAAFFRSPNDNIGCGFAAPSKSETFGTVRCEITVKSWQPPPKPQTCGVDWGAGVTLDSRAAVLCASNTIRGNATAVQLPYGTSMRFAPFTCSSEPTGVECVNTATGAGFLLGRERYELRNP